VSPSGWNTLHELAASELNCPIGQLTAKTLESKANLSPKKWSFELTGCGGTEIVALVDAYDMWIYSDMDLRKKLKFTFGDRCPTWAVEFIDSATRGVTACDEKLVYVITPSGWVANTAAKGDGNAK
jgi:hypothetical protein